jgi:hypothetical protein
MVGGQVFPGQPLAILRRIFDFNDDSLPHMSRDAWQRRHEGQTKGLYIFKIFAKQPDEL